MKRTWENADGSQAFSEVLNARSLAQACVKENLTQVKEVMTGNPACCLPVVENQENRNPTAMITDRDIAVRGVTQEKHANNMRAADCMSSSVVIVALDDIVDDCRKVMADN